MLIDSLEAENFNFIKIQFCEALLQMLGILYTKVI